METQAPYKPLKPRVQVVRTAPRRILVGSYLTAKGKRLAEQGADEETLSKYRKNRYTINKKSKQLKEIKHPYQS